MDTPLDEHALDELLAALKPGEALDDLMPSLLMTVAPSENTPDPEAMEGIWIRGDEETARAYACFLAYLDQGRSRSLVGAYRQETGKKAARQSSGHWNGWYRDHNWRTRAEAYDARLDEAKRQAEVEKWKKRGEDLVEEQYTVATAMLAKAQQMLAFPLVAQTVEGKKGPVTIEPARWNFNSAARLAKVAVEMARLATGLPTKNEQSVHFEIDPSQLTDEQIDRILAGEHPAAVVAAPSKGDSVHRQP